MTESAESRPLSMAELMAREGVAAKPTPPRKKSQSRLALIGLATVVVLVAVYYVTILLVAQAKIHRVDALRLNGPEILEPSLQTNADNFLIVVSDKSQAQITALAHLSGSTLVIVSFPRDTLIDVPACGGQSAFTATIAAAYAKGGPQCSVAGIQTLTGIRINHYVGIDLASFPNVINAIGGVSVCLGAPLDDPDHGVKLPAGINQLNGQAATNYVRAVAGGVGDDDPARASRQIAFLSTVFADALGVKTLANPVRAARLAFASAGVLTLDKQTTLGQLRKLGDGLQRASLVVPPAQLAADAKYVALDPAGSRTLFDAMITGQPLPGAPASNAPAPVGC